MAVLDTILDAAAYAAWLTADTSDTADTDAEYDRGLYAGRMDAERGTIATYEPVRDENYAAGYMAAHDATEVLWPALHAFYPYDRSN